MPPDNQATLGALGGAAGDLEAALGLDPAVDPDLIDIMGRHARIARLIAETVLVQAMACDPTNPALQLALAEGDVLGASGSFKDAVNKYKDTLAKSEGVLSSCS